MVHYSRILDTALTHLRNVLKKVGPKPGGFRCAVDEESANGIFHDFAINSIVVWAGVEE